jgi:homoserine O-acetyltransferase
LAGVTLHYAVYGRLNAARDNAVLVCHALSGSALVGSWWPEIFAPGAVLSLEHDFVICINMLGSCYGSTGPGSVDPRPAKAYGPDFPLVSIRDNVRAQAKLLDSLGIRRLRLVLGGSIGGMQALDWAIHDPERVERALVIGVAPLSAMGLALNHLQRQAIQHDPEWAGGAICRSGLRGGGFAGAADRHDQLQVRGAVRRALWPQSQPQRRRSLGVGQPGRRRLIGGRFDIAGYLDHQGERFIERFDANSYLAILRTMDTWDPLRG